MAKKRRKYDKLDNPTRPCPYDKQVQCVQRTGEEVHDWACCQCNTRTKAAESLAQAFHETYERLAPDYSYKTRKASAVQWENVPEPNKSLMIGVAGEILDKRFVLAIDTLAEQLAAKDKEIERLKAERDKLARAFGGCIGPDGDRVAACDPPCIVCRVLGNQQKGKE